MGAFGEAWGQSVIFGAEIRAGTLSFHSEVSSFRDQSKPCTPSHPCNDTVTCSPFSAQV